jgi:Zn-dependent protease
MVNFLQEDQQIETGQDPGNPGEKGTAMYCGRCGKEDEYQGRFCHYCGVEFATLQGSPDTPSADWDSTVQEAPAARPAPSRKGLWGLLTAAGVLLLKFGKVALLGLAKFKGALSLVKFSKFLTTGLSMFVSVGFYAALWPWQFAVGFVVLLFVHEMGHVLMIRRHGLKASAPVFVPFFGAAIALREQPQNAQTEAEIGIAGPILGTVGAFACLGLSFLTGNPLFLALTYIGFMLNLFNLIPLGQLDGGRVAAAISPKLWLVGLIAMLVAYFKWHNPIMLFILIVSAPQVWHTLKSGPNPAYYTVAPAARAVLTLLYLGLALTLGIGMFGIHASLEGLL